jgi:hypothetical protein
MFQAEEQDGDSRGAARVGDGCLSPVASPCAPNHRSHAAAFRECSATDPVLQRGVTIEWRYEGPET